MDRTDFVMQLKKQLKQEFQMHIRNGVYAMTQKSMAYNSNRIEGSTLTSRQTAEIFDTGTITGTQDFVFKTKDVEEMTGHFKMFNEIIKNIGKTLTADMIKAFHYQLKNGVFEDYANGYPVGEFKNRANQVSDITTVLPEDVPAEIEKLLFWWKHCDGTLEDIAKFHARYEEIHPFQDGNGRTGRAVILKQCLDHNIVPVIIYDDDKIRYYQALSTAQHDKNYAPLIDFFSEEQEKYYEQVKHYVILQTEEVREASDLMQGFIDDLGKKLSNDVTCSSCSIGETVRCIVTKGELSIGIDFISGDIVVSKDNRIFSNKDMKYGMNESEKKLFDMVVAQLSFYMSEKADFRFSSYFYKHGYGKDGSGEISKKPSSRRSGAR